MNELKQILEKDEKFRYQLLNRMKSDCDYYLGYGNRHSISLWAKNEKEQIAYMKAIWNSFSEDNKPEWLTYEQILEYEEKLCGPEMNKSVNDYICKNFAAYGLPVHDEDHMRSFLNKLEAHGETFEHFLEGFSYSYDFINTYSVKLAFEFVDECNAFFPSWNDLAEMLIEPFDSIDEAIEYLKAVFKYDVFVLTTNGIVELNIVQSQHIACFTYTAG